MWLPALDHYAETIDLDMRAFKAETADRIYRQRKHEHRRSEELIGLRGSPTSFLNGAVVDVSFGLEHLELDVRAALVCLGELLKRSVADGSIPAWEHASQAVVAHHAVMEERICGMRSDEEMAGGATDLVNLLRPFHGGLGLVHQRRKVPAEV